MKPASFEYHAPADLDEAVRLLAGDDEAKVLAGGQSLVPLMNMRLARPGVVVDINRIPGLDYIRANGELAVGALVRHNDLLASEAVRTGWPLLHEGASNIGHPAIRNRGTVCGSIAHADPAAEHPAIVAALDATIVIQGPGGRREAKADEFFLTYLTTSIGADEIVVEVRYPKLPAGTGTCFMELSRRHGDFAIVGVAAALTIAGGVCTDARLALTGVGGTPFRAQEAEALLKGKRLAGDAAAAAAAFQEAGRQIAGAVEPDDDIHASARYRKHLSGVLTERALAKALDRVGGN